MENVLFLQSDVKCPYTLYANMLTHAPVYYDSTNKIWAIYTFAACQSILNNASSCVPQSNLLFSTESSEVTYIINHLARLSNPPHHVPPRKAATDLMMHWKMPDTADLLHYLIGEPRKPAFIDWVKAVCTKLPALALLKGFNFSSHEIDLLLPEIESLVKIMLPSRTNVQNEEVNKAVAVILPIVNSYTFKKYKLKEELKLYSANLIGLLIQSYDAGRGLLSNALLCSVATTDSLKDVHYFKLLIREVLRYDPPVHNTRRVLLTESITINNQVIKPGENILLVLAAANRDPTLFANADVFNPLRKERPQYLTYGAGIHQCLAEHLSIHLTATTLHYLYNKYRLIQMEEQEIKYEPKVNVRLPVKINITLS